MSNTVNSITSSLRHFISRASILPRRVKLVIVAFSDGVSKELNVPGALNSTVLDTCDTTLVVNKIKNINDRMLFIKVQQLKVIK